MDQTAELVWSWRFTYRVSMSRKGESALRQLTVRGFGDDVERRVRALARAEGISLNEAVLRLLRRGAGLGSSQGGADVVGDSLDHLAGTWSADELREFTDAVRPTEQVDAAFWNPGAPRKPRRRTR